MALTVAIAATPWYAVLAKASSNPSGWRKADPLDAALNKIYNAEYRAGVQMLEAWLKNHPDDFRALTYLAETMIDDQMLQEQLFNGAAYMNSGTVFHEPRQPLPAAFEQRVEGIFDRAQTLEEARLRRNSKDREALYWLGVTYSRRAEFDFVLLRSYFAALREGEKSLKLNQRLLKIDPAFTDAYFVVGLAKYTVGLLPWYIRWVTSLAGVHGNVSQGLADLERVRQYGHYARVDAEIVLVPLYEREKKYSEALALLCGLERAYPENYLAPLEIARIQKAQRNWRAAARTYDQAVAIFVHGPESSRRIPKVEMLYRAGQAHQEVGELQKALDFYHEASQLPGSSLQIYEAALAAGRLDQHFDHTPRAKREYELVASAVPNTELGRQARQALESLH